MILVSFSFNGDTVRLEVIGSKPMGGKFENHYLISKINDQDGTLFNKDNDKFKTLYEWCKIHCTGKVKRGRETNFAF